MKIIILLIFLASCGHPSKWQNDDLMQYVYEFQAQSMMHQVTIGEMGDAGLNLRVVMFVKPDFKKYGISLRELRKQAHCHKEHSKIGGKVHTTKPWRELWVSKFIYGEWHRRELIFHELGRCWLKMGLSDDPWAIMAGKMVPEIEDDEWMEDNWESRVDQMFADYKWGYDPDYK